MSRRGIRYQDLPRDVREKLRKDKKVRKASKRAESAETANFMAFCTAAGLPTPQPEHRFAQSLGREWRFDWAFEPDGRKVALEVEGGVWTEGRHTRGAGYVEDMEKYNSAAVLGWRLIRVTPDQLYTGETILWIRRALKAG